MKSVGNLGWSQLKMVDYLNSNTGGSVVRLDQIIAGDAMMPGAPAARMHRLGQLHLLVLLQCQ